MEEMKSGSDVLPIDLVVTWVDQDDKKWLKKYAEYSESNERDYEIRYRDYGTLMYLFRSIEKYAPWINQVYLVTDEQVPDFLNIDSVTVIDHKDIIPEDYLPTFNSNVIEWHLTNIKGLSEHFLYFNDDMFFNAPVRPEDFFDHSGKIKDNIAYNLIMPTGEFDHVYVNNMSIVNRVIDKKSWQRKHLSSLFNLKNGPWNLVSLLLYPFPRFSRFYDSHTPIAYRKSDIESTIERFPEIKNTFLNRRRGTGDYSLWVVRYLNFLEKGIVVRDYKFGVHVPLDKVQKVVQIINDGTSKLINVNDAENMSHHEFTKAIDDFQMALQVKLPNKSKFEK
ncbi:stealth family protein [Weissella confusa]